MNAFERLWLGLIEPGPSLTDPEERRRSRLMLSLLVPLVPLGVLLSTLAPLLSANGGAPFSHPATFVGLGASVLLLVAYFVARSRHSTIAASMIVAIVTVGAWGGFIAARTDAHSGFILSFLGIGLLLSGILMPLAGTLALCVVDVAGVVILPTLFPDLPPDFALVPSLFVGVIAFLVAISSAVRSGDSRERRRAEDMLRLEEERYRNLVESSPDGIVLVAGGRVVYANPAAVGLFGASSTSDLLGLSPLNDLVDPAYVSVIQERMAAIERLGARTKPLEIRVKRLDGTTVDVEVMGAPAIHDGRPADQTIVRDITARKQAQEARSQIEKLESINALKTQLLNMASHELNTPISALRLQIHMLKRGGEDPDPRRAKAVAILDRNVDRLAMLVKDILDVARMQSGQLKLRREPTELLPVLDEAAELYAHAYLEKGVNLRVTGTSAVVDADAQRVTQVLVNLLSNALKFTPPGGEVTLSSVLEGGEAIVRVKDSGKGLTQEQIDRLFQPFSQVHDTAVETKGGTGLGLHISRGIIEQHNGRIYCESDGPGTGTSFVFTLPLARPALLGEKRPADGAAPEA